VKTWHWLVIIGVVVLVVPVPGWNGLTLWNHFGQGIPVASVPGTTAATRPMVLGVSLGVTLPSTNPGILAGGGGQATT